MVMKTMAWAAMALMIAVAGPARAETCAGLGASQYVDFLQFCVSSVLAPQSGNRYGPENLFDGNPRTAWCEGVAGNGVGQTITLSWAPTQRWRSLFVHNGYQKSDKAFHDNARPRRLRVETDDGVVADITLADRFGEQTVSLPRWSDSRRVRLTLLDVYPGRRWQDTCLDSLGIDFEEAGGAY